MPGDFRRRGYVAEAWYEHRLGLIGDDGLPPATPTPFSSAFDWYARLFVSGEHPRWVDLEKARDDHDGDEAGYSWRYTGVRRPRTVVRDPRRRGRLVAVEGSARVNPPRGSFPMSTALTRRHLLANVWRGAFDAAAAADPAARLLGVDHALLDPAFVEVCLRRAAAAGSLGDEAVRLARVYLGPGADTSAAAVARQVRRGSLVLPRSELWRRVATAYDGVGHIVVDVDHDEGGGEWFRAAMRLLMRSPGLPRPHLVVTSESGRGRHLYYFTDGVAGRSTGGQDQEEFLRYSGPFREAVERALGIGFRDGVVEVFPKRASAGENMPNIPFGPTSFLCDPDDGLQVLAHDPRVGLRLWHERASPSFRPLTLGAIRATSGAGADPGDVALVARAAARRPRSGAEAASSPGSRPAAAARATVADARALLEDGPRRGETNHDLWTLARYLVRNQGAAPADAERQLVSWVAPLVDDRDPTRTLKAYLAKIRDYVEAVEVPLPAGRLVYRLFPSDCLAVARAVAGWRTKEVPDRKALLVVMLGFICVARHRGVETGRARGVPVSAERLLAVWSRHYATAVRTLRRRRWLGVDAPRDIDGGRCTEYRFEVPAPEGDAVVLGGHGELLGMLARSVPDDLGAVLAGARNWANWRSAAGMDRSAT